jgi:hypothetical protein
MLETMQRPPRMIPRRHDDDAFGTQRAKQWDGKLGVLAGGSGFALQEDVCFGDAIRLQDVFIGHVVAKSADNDYGRFPGLKQFRRAFGTVGRASQHHHGVGFCRAAVLGQHSFREEKQARRRNHQQQARGEDKFEPPTACFQKLNNHRWTPINTDRNVFGPSPAGGRRFGASFPVVNLCASVSIRGCTAASASNFSISAFQFSAFCFRPLSVSARQFFQMPHAGRRRIQSAGKPFRPPVGNDRATRIAQC